MMLVLRKYLALFGFMITLMASTTSLCFAANPFTVSFVSGPSNSGTPTLFNMVPNSKQQLKFNVTSNDKNFKIVKCSLSNSALDSAVILAGCTNSNGAATPAPIIITLTSGSRSGPVTHILTVKDFSGRNVVKIPLSYNIVRLSILCL